MRRVKHILSYVLVLSMCFTLFFFPLNVFAENETYLEVNNCFVLYTGRTSGNEYYSYTSDTVRSVILTNNNSEGAGTYTYYFVSTSNFEYANNTSNSIRSIRIIRNRTTNSSRTIISNK